MDMNELSIAFQDAGFDDVQSNIMKNGHSSFDVEFEKPNSFWRIFVLLACCFLFVEMAILKFWK